MRIMRVMLTVKIYALPSQPRSDDYILRLKTKHEKDHGTSKNQDG